MSTVNKQGKSYDGVDVRIMLLGSVDNEVSEINYDYVTDHQNNYYLGNPEPSSWSQGKVEYKGDITFSMKTLVALEDAIGGEKRLDKIKPFDIIVTYLNEFNKVVTDIVTCKFKGQGRDGKGDMGLNYKIDLHIIGIKFNKG